MQNFQKQRAQSAPGASVSLAGVTNANRRGMEAGLGAVDGIGNFRKIRNENTIQSLLSNSDSANFGKNVGQIMSLAADTTAGGSAAATGGINAFQNKATSDLNGLGKILAANKGTSSTTGAKGYLSALKEYEKLKNFMPKQSSESDDDYGKRKFKYDNNLAAAKRNVIRNQSLIGGSAGNQGMVDETARTMNKYFDRKMDFGQSNGVGGNGAGAGGKTPIQQIVQENAPQLEQSPVEKIKSNKVKKEEKAAGFNPEPALVNILKNAIDLNAKGPKGKVNPYVRPARPGTLQIDRPGKVGARAPETTGVKGQNWTQGKKPGTPNMKIDPNLKNQFKVPGPGKTNIIDTVKDIGKNVIKNPGNLLKALNPGVAGGIFSSTDMGDASLYTNSKGETVDANGNAPGVFDGGGQVQFLDANGKRIVNPTPEQLVGSTMVYPGDKGYTQPKALDNIEKSKYIQKGSPVQGTEAFSMNFDADKSAIEARHNLRVADQALADAKYKEFTAQTPMEKVSAQAEVRALEKTVGSLRSANANDRATGVVEDNLKKYDGNDSKMATNVTQLVKDATGNKGDYNLLKNSLSKRSYAILDKIIKSPSIKSENGQYSVALGESSAGFGGNNLVLTGDSRIDLAQQYLQLMMNVSQNPESTKKFIDENFPEEHRRIVYDQINPDSKSVYQSDKSNFLMRNFRNTPVADAPMSPDHGGLIDDGGVIPNWIDENIKG